MTTFKDLRISYREVQRARFCLAQYTLKQFNKVSLPVHFFIKMFTLAALDNFNYLDQSSPRCTESGNDT